MKFDHEAHRHMSERTAQRSEWAAKLGAPTPRTRRQNYKVSPAPSQHWLAKAWRAIVRWC